MGNISLERQSEGGNCLVSANFSSPSCSSGSNAIGVANNWEGAQTLTYGKILLQECSDDHVESNKLVVAFIKLRLASNLGGPCDSESTSTSNFSAAVLFCNPRYTIGQASVTSTSSGAINNVIAGDQQQFTESAGWEMALALNATLNTSATLFLTNNMIEVQADAYNSRSPYDFFFNALRAIWYRAPLDQYLDAETLKNHSQQLFRTTSAQIASQYLRANSTNDIRGAYSADQLRVILQGPFLVFVEVGLGLIMLCTIVIAIVRPIVPGLCALPTLGRTACIMSQSTQLENTLRGHGALSEKNRKPISREHPPSQS